MYALIRGTGSFIGVFSSKKTMQTIIELLIKEDCEKNGRPCGNFNFRWIQFKADQPWFTINGIESPKETNALLSLSTMHTEKFTHKVMTDWSTGKIISMDGKETTNVNSK